MYSHIYQYLAWFQNKTYNTTALNEIMLEKVELPFTYDLTITFPTEPVGKDLYWAIQILYYYLLNTYR